MLNFKTCGTRAKVYLDAQSCQVFSEGLQDSDQPVGAQVWLACYQNALHTVGTHFVCYTLYLSAVRTRLVVSCT